MFILSVHEHDRLGSGMLTVERAVIPGLYLIALIYFVDFNSSNYDRKGLWYLVEYYLESVEEYSLSEGKIHMSEPEPGNVRKCKYGVLC